MLLKCLLVQELHSAVHQHCQAPGSLQVTNGLHRLNKQQQECHILLVPWVFTKGGIVVSGGESWSEVTAPDLPADILPGTQ